MCMRIIFFALVMIAGEAQPPWFGTWKLNPVKSTPNTDARFRRVLTDIEPWKDGLKVTYDMVGIRGGIAHMEWTGKFDGKDYPVQGVDYVLTNAYTLLSDHSYRIVIKVDGAVAATSTVVISTDGKTLTTTTQADKVTTSVYEKQ